MSDPKWLQIAKELQFLSQSALAYCKDIYDIERFERIREISLEMMTEASGLPKEKVKNLFCSEEGFQTPKLDTRAAIFKEEKILLVQEKNGLWSLPGGWVDALETVRSNTIKEVREEAGLNIEPIRIIALHDKNTHNPQPYAFNILKIFVLCKELGGAFQPNCETIASQYFKADELPPLAENKNTQEQVLMCFQAANSPTWEIPFD